MAQAANTDRLLKALAAALVERPRASLKELAQAAGVSKATLHRFCGTREQLMLMLERHGCEVMEDVLADADLTQAEPLAALRRLIGGHLRHRELLVFLMFQYRPDSLEPGPDGNAWTPYGDALDAFFLRGQKSGCFRIDIPAQVLTELFVSLIYGMVDAERRGRAASFQSAAVLEQFFLEGAGRR
jgi:TetR/AcrR family transcriptional regulator, mexCD-oprJ operon repressor